MLMSRTEQSGGEIGLKPPRAGGDLPCEEGKHLAGRQVFFLFRLPSESREINGRDLINKICIVNSCS